MIHPKGRIATARLEPVPGVAELSLRSDLIVSNDYYPNDSGQLAPTQGQDNKNAFELSPPHIIATNESERHLEIQNILFLKTIKAAQGFNINFHGFKKYFPIAENFRIKNFETLNFR